MFGLLGDKDLAGVIEPLLGVVAQWAVAPLPTPRSRSAEELQAALQARSASASVWPSVAAALDAQAGQAAEDDEILVFGSFYSVAVALHWLEQHDQSACGS
ncbi:Bifunctional protein FolC [compost metagenome]